MNNVLDKFAHNFIIDEMVYWPPCEKKVVSIHPSVPNVGKCSVLIKYHDASEYVVEIEHEYFEKTWNEACTVLKAVTTIKGDFSPLTEEAISSLELNRQRWTGIARKVYSEKHFE